MAVIIAGQVGEQPATGVGTNLRQGKQADLTVSELHGRFYEENYAGRLYAGGMSVSALSANTITLTNTTTPILGLWNPITSGVNLIVLQAALVWFPNTFTLTSNMGAFVWAASTGNTGTLSAGLTPWNRKTLQQAGSVGKFFTPATALTGLSSNLVIMEGAAEIISTGAVNFGTFPGTALVPDGNGLCNVDGSIIVPPGGVLALLNTTSTTQFSVAGRLLWEEVPA